MKIRTCQAVNDYGESICNEPISKDKRVKYCKKHIDVKHNKSAKKYRERQKFGRKIRKPKKYTTYPP